MEKVVEDKVFNWRPPMFSCIHLRKRQQCCMPKISGETQVTNKISPKSSKDQIQYMTMCERSIMWYCFHGSCHLLFRWAWLHFKMVNLDERSRTLVIFFWDGHGFILKWSILMNVPFIWGMGDTKWSWNLWHQDKPWRINIRWRRK